MIMDLGIMRGLTRMILAFVDSNNSIINLYIFITYEQQIINNIYFLKEMIDKFKLSDYIMFVTEDLFANETESKPRLFMSTVMIN